MQRPTTNTASTTRTPTWLRDALGSLVDSEDVASRLYEAVRDSLRGRGRNRRDAEELVTAHAPFLGLGLIPLLLAVRDELAREVPPPRGLAGRTDALLLAVAESARSEPSASPKKRNGAARSGDRAGHLLHHLLDLAPDAVLTLRESGGVGVWNQAGREITGRRRRDIQRRGPRSLFKEPEAFDALLQELASGRGVKPREAVLLHAKGEEVPIRIFAARLEQLSPERPDADRYLLFLHDLSEVHGIRRRLSETEKLSAMVKIVGSVAHEFRNPLNSLFLSADLLEDELAGHGAAEEAIAPTLAAIREEVERLNQIINHYLALSKVESTAPEIVDLGETVPRLHGGVAGASRPAGDRPAAPRPRGRPLRVRRSQPGPPRAREPGRERLRRLGRVGG